MPGLEQTSNCGIYELSGVREFSFRGDENHRIFFDDLDQQLNGTGEDWRYPGIILFSDARTKRSRAWTAGDNFAGYIMEHHLGEMTWSAWKKNPNTGNYIKMWMWYPNHRNLDRLFGRIKKEPRV